MSSNIHIKKSHRGKFTAYCKRHGVSLSEGIRKFRHSNNKAVKAMAVFAANARKFKH